MSGWRTKGCDEGRNGRNGFAIKGPAGGFRHATEGEEGMLGMLEPVFPVAERVTKEGEAL